MKMFCDTDWRFYVSCDYSTYYPNYGCQCPDYCRCSRICDTRVTDVSVSEMAKRLVEDWLKSGMHLAQRSDRTLLTYTVERVLTAYAVYLSDDWGIEVVGGYYGEEIGRVRWTGTDQVDRDLAALTATSDPNEWVKVALTAEYGFVLDELKDATFDVATVNLDQLREPKVAKPDRRPVPDDNTPAGLVLDDGAGLRLIDGHHRFTNLRRAGRTTALYVVARTGTPTPKLSLSERRKAASTKAAAALAELAELAALADSDTLRLTVAQMETLRDTADRLCRTSTKKR